jgi:dTDP-4-dehydrorhamnose 3,5-epimerase
MNFLDTNGVKDLVLLEPKVFGDDRGYFFESWNRELFAAVGISKVFVQDNQSRSQRGVLRGLHYQTRYTQGKLVRVISGEVFDVAVDLRKNSSSYGKWFATILSEHNKRIFWIPPGFAHGFLVLSETADLVYKCTRKYSPKHNVCIRWDDPDLNIQWPMQPNSLSAKDSAGILFKDAPKF